MDKKIEKRMKNEALSSHCRVNKEKLFRLRTNRGWSQEQAAEICGIYNVRQYIRLENGETKRPRRDTLECLTKGFGLDNPDAIILLPTDEPDQHDVDFYQKSKSDTHKLLYYKHNIDVKPKKLIVLGLDNTILNGYDFSWKLVWDYLGLDDNLRKEGIRNFRQGITTYKAWVDWKCKLFKEKKLNKRDFSSILKDVYLIDGFYEFVRYCKHKNYSLAIVSGGIDTFLEVMLPDYRYIFNYVAINKFIYDKKGYLKDVIPTPYDFEEKSTAIKDMRKDSEISFEDTFFIGCGYNNIYAINAAATCIAINTKSIQLTQGFNYNIEETDLSKVISYL